jgi:hypothetical protein
LSLSRLSRGRIVKLMDDGMLLEFAVLKLTTASQGQA